MRKRSFGYHIRTDNLYITLTATAPITFNITGIKNTNNNTNTGSTPPTTN